MTKPYVALALRQGAAAPREAAQEEQKPPGQCSILLIGDRAIEQSSAGNAEGRSQNHEHHGEDRSS
jgi:hypothetical protein